MKSISCAIVYILGMVSLVAAGHQRRASNYCPPQSECMPLEACPLLNTLMSSQCLVNDKMRELQCGRHNSRMVCCPQASNDLDSTAAGSLTLRKVDGVRCGVSIVHGEQYKGLGAYPWVVRIGFRNLITGEVKYPCSGSIINKRVILTAAHCALAKADNFKLVGVRVGEWDADSDVDCGSQFCGLPTQDIFVSHIIVHPGYHKQSYTDNIAMMVLKTDINYTVTAQPICLPEPWSVTNNNGLLVGWGKRPGQRVTPSYQQHLEIPIKNIQMCHDVYGQTLPITENQICAGGEAGNDACSGFGGSPLIVRHGDTHYQVGIMSFGATECGAEGIPSVYTSVKKYAKWIESNMP